MNITIDNEGIHGISQEDINNHKRDCYINKRYKMFLEISKYKKNLSNTYCKLVIQSLKTEELKYELSQIQYKINELQLTFDNLKQNEQ